MRTNDTLKYKTRNPIKNFLIKQFKKELLNLVQFTQAKRVLDAGCGEGYILDFLNSRIKDWHLEGFDSSGELVKKAKEKVTTAELNVRDIYNCQYPDKSFDLVMNTEVLEHLEYPERALTEIKRLTKRWVILSVPNEPLFSLSNFLTGKDIRSLGRNPDHINRWKGKDFLNLIKRHFLIIRIVRPFPWLVLLCEIHPKNKNETEH